MTTETPEPRFERFCPAYPSGTVVMHYGGGAALGEVRITHPLAAVEAVEASWVSVGIPEAGRFAKIFEFPREKTKVGKGHGEAGDPSERERGDVKFCVYATNYASKL
jgi:hypothetical protein